MRKRDPLYKSDFGTNQEIGSYFFRKDDKKNKGPTGLKKDLTLPKPHIENKSYDEMQNILQAAAVSKPIDVRVVFKRKGDKGLRSVRAYFGVGFRNNVYIKGDSYSSESDFRANFVTQMFSHLENMLGGSFGIKPLGNKDKKGEYHLTIFPIPKFKQDLKEFQKEVKEMGLNKGKYLGAFFLN